MSINFLRLNSLGRSQGRNIAAALAYLTREELEDRRTGLVYDYEKRGGLIGKGTLFPELEKGGWTVREKTFSRQEKEEFCFAVEVKETRKNGRLAKEVLVAIPVELDREKQIELARNFAEKLVERYRVGAFWAIHEPPKGGDSRNIHLHILLTTRVIEANGSLGEKVRALDAKSEMECMKKIWKELANEMLPEEKKLVEVKKDPLAEPKLPHLGRKATWYERQTGQKSRKRMEYEALVEKWQTCISELKELKRQRQELERQWAEQKLKQEQEEYKEKYQVFSAMKEMINHVDNPLIGIGTEKEIILPDKTLTLGELRQYSLKILEQNFVAVCRQIGEDLNRRISELPPEMGELISRPIGEIERIASTDLIDLITEVRALEKVAQQEQERQREEQEKLRRERPPSKRKDTPKKSRKDRNALELELE